MDLNVGAETTANEQARRPKGSMPPTRQELFEVTRDEVEYRCASQDVARAKIIINGAVRRAKKLKVEPFQDCRPGEFDRYQRRIAEGERQMDEIRAKYAGRTRVSLHISLEELGEGFVAAREAAGLSQADLACRLDTPIADVQRWEACAYGDLPLARLMAVVRAIGLQPTTCCSLYNAVAHLTDWVSPA